MEHLPLASLGERYAAAFMPVLRQYGGRLVVADGSPEVAEGEWDGNRVD
jgi:uncharacterized protein (DUF1330 family)